MQSVRDPAAVAKPSWPALKALGHAVRQSLDFDSVSGYVPNDTGVRQEVSRLRRESGQQWPAVTDADKTPSTMRPGNVEGVPAAEAKRIMGSAMFDLDEAIRAFGPVQCVADAAALERVPFTAEELRVIAARSEGQPAMLVPVLPVGAPALFGAAGFRGLPVSVIDETDGLLDDTAARPGWFLLRAPREFGLRPRIDALGLAQFAISQAMQDRWELGGMTVLSTVVLEGVSHHLRVMVNRAPSLTFFLGRNKRL